MNKDEVVEVELTENQYADCCDACDRRLNAIKEGDAVSEKFFLKIAKNTQDKKVDEYLRKELAILEPKKKPSFWTQFRTQFRTHIGNKNNLRHRPL
ncbi:MAG: hypothetical protein PHP50_12955 [Lachnospiraceae bacterium]|nr:hypothetical protein [Lachnospiraceae bacterium]